MQVKALSYKNHQVSFGPVFAHFIYLLLIRIFYYMTDRQCLSKNFFCEIQRTVLLEVRFHDSCGHLGKEKKKERKKKKKYPLQKKKTKHKTKQKKMKKN